MIATKCYRFRLEPTSEQKQTFLQFAGCRRAIWNWGLARKQAVYRSTGKGIYYKALAAELTVLKRRPDAFFLKECNAQVLQQVLMDLDKAFVAFFEKRSRYPRFKKRKKDLPSFRMPQEAKIVGNSVYLPKIGLVKARLHREVKGTLRSATIKQESDRHWYIVFVSHFELPDVAPRCDNPVGIDVGLISFITLDTGEKVDPPKFYRRGQRKLKRLQRAVARCKAGSNNRTRAKLRVTKHHKRVANQRNDFLHQQSARLVAQHDTICVENLNLKGLTRTKLSRSFNDAALGAFFRMLNYKTVYRFGQVATVGRFYRSSKTCHDCGHVQCLDLSERTRQCLGCGRMNDRDTNAARNIKSEGLRLLKLAGYPLGAIGDSINARRESVNPEQTQVVFVEARSHGACPRW